MAALAVLMQRSAARENYVIRASRPRWPGWLPVRHTARDLVANTVFCGELDVICCDYISVGGTEPWLKCCSARKESRGNTRCVAKMFSEAAFVTTLISFIILERFVNAIGLLFARLAFGTGDDPSSGTGSTVKGYASIQVLGAGATYVTTLFGSAVGVVGTVLGGLVAYLFWVLVVTLCFSVLFVAQQYYPEFLIRGVEYWNDFIGPFLNTVAVVPAQIIDPVFSALVPVYDSSVWFVQKLVYNVFVMGAIRNMQPFTDIGIAVTRLVSNLVVGIITYFTALVNGCEKPVTDACYDPGRRVLDLVTPMIPLRDAAAASSVILKDMCNSLTGPTDMLLYPFLVIALDCVCVCVLVCACLCEGV